MAKKPRRRKPRRRRYVGRRLLPILPIVGFRYDARRNAYILRIIGDRRGPVIRERGLPTWSHPRSGQRRTDRESISQARVPHRTAYEQAGRGNVVTKPLREDAPSDVGSKDEKVQKQRVSDTRTESSLAAAASPTSPALTHASHTRRRGSRRFVFALVGLAVVVWLGIAAVELALGVIEGNRAVNAVDDARTRLSGQLSGGGFLADTAAADLATAHQHLSASHAHLSNPALTPFTLVPVLGRQLTSARDMLGSASTVAASGQRAITQANAILAQPHGPGAPRVAALQRLSEVAAGAQASIANLDLGPSRGLFGFLADQRNKFGLDLAKAQDGLGRSAVACRAAANLIATPGQYLLLAGNNAEMRAGSGLFLQAGTLTTGGGRIHLGPMRSTGDIFPPQPGVPLRGDLAARWGWYQGTFPFLSVGLTPEFGVNGPLAAQIWEASTGQRVDGVIAVDIEGLRQVLTAVGSVSTPDGTVVNADNAVPYLMHDQYLGTTVTGSSNGVRRDNLGAIAQAAFQAVDDDQANLRAMATGLARAAQGRHVMIWTAQPSTEASWQQARVTGQVNQGDLMAGVVSRGGNKLDYYLKVNANLDVRQAGANRSDLTMHIHLVNRTPPAERQPSYIAGPEVPGAAPGEYVGILAVNLPGWATDVSVDGYSTFAAAGPEGPTVLRAVPFDLKAGAQQDIVLHFSGAAAHSQLQVIPSARVPAVTWSNGSQTFTDASPHVVSW